ncbi:Retrovirus-related Pol polyprotein from transposon 17.6 [Eumeta japonica]|uniref:Retrovirus-related Pol polyprotein from transposon 17.6 n=1 Tax=Eumeta variegata TaxID=151549 RepID=A0A4C1XL17_EUMVA|nr:Retrovirus-related Pol polyprotein from transposon 17.6 [Eumeta japonica]
MTVLMVIRALDAALINDFASIIIEEYISVAIFFHNINTCQLYSDGMTLFYYLSLLTLRLKALKKYVEGEEVSFQDASILGIGAVLKQPQENNEEKPVAYFSKKLNEIQKRKKAAYLECLAIKECVKYWQHVLIGKQFNVFSDHKPLENMNIKSRTDEELGDLTYYLSQYDFQIKYSPGRYNIEADCLSRNPVLEANENLDEQLKVPPQNHLRYVPLIQLEDFGVRGRQREHTVTGYAPRYLLNGTDVTILPNELKLKKTESDLIQDRRKALENKIKSHNYNKKIYDKNLRHLDFKVADTVFVDNGKLNRKKLDELRIAPFMIIEKISNSIYKSLTANRDAVQVRPQRLLLVNMRSPSQINEVIYQRRGHIMRIKVIFALYKRVALWAELLEERINVPLVFLLLSIYSNLFMPLRLTLQLFSRPSTAGLNIPLSTNLGQIVTDGMNLIVLCESCQMLKRAIYDLLRRVELHLNQSPNHWGSLTYFVRHVPTFTCYRIANVDRSLVFKFLAAMIIHGALQGQFELARKAAHLKSQI